MAGLGFLLVAVLAACSSAPSSPTVAPDILPTPPAPVNTGGYPVTLTLMPPETPIISESYPGVASTEIALPDTFDPAWLTPKVGTGSAKGKLVSGVSTNTPYLAGELYLGRLIQANQSGAPPLVSVSPDVDPKAVARTNDGTFVFSNVPGGVYILIVWTPMNPFVVEVPGEGPKQVVIEAGKLTDLGGTVIP
jgi:hypothetical protein